MPPKPGSRSGSATRSPVRNTSLTRKRRISVDDDHDDTPDDGCNQSQAIPEEPAPTPRKVVKRVRFSDLGPELATTGLTPFVRRTTLSPSASDPIQRPSDSVRRRRSLPPSLPSSTTEQTSPTIERIQFTPLRQVLDGRMRRRLRRSHLSEELNDFQADQRAFSKAQTELNHLRSQEEKRQETIRQLTLDLELQRQLGIEVNAEEEQRMRELQLELADWKARAVEIKQEDDSGLAQIEDAPALPTHRIHYPEEIPTEPSSPWEEETFFSSPTSRRAMNMEMSSPISADKSLSAPTSTHASCQASMPDFAHQVQVQAFEEAVNRLTQESSDAKSALELVKSELQSLGFAAGDANDEDIVSSLREAFRAARMQLEHLLPGETVGGTEKGDFLLGSMLMHLKKLVDIVKSDKKTIDRHQQAETALRGQFNATVRKATDLEQRLAVVDSHRTNLIREIDAKDEELEESRHEVQAQLMEVKKNEKHIAQLESEAEEQCTSLNRLQAALITYREEVTSLETLVIKMEGSSTQKESELAELRDQLQSAVIENEETCRILYKLRQDVQHSAFELSALAKPDLKANVTLRRPRRINRSCHDMSSSEPHQEGRADTDKQKAHEYSVIDKPGANKRDSGVAMVDDRMAAE